MSTGYQPKVRRLQGGNVLEAAEGGEINVLAGATLNVDGTLNIDGSPVEVAPVAVDEITDVDATAAELNTLDGAPAATTTIGVGAETGGDTITVTIQLKDANDADLATRATVFAYLSDDANGDSIAGTAPSGGVAINTDGLLIPVVANKAFYLTSEADGDIALDIVEAAGDTWYLILVLPNGLLKASGAITFGA
jgi:hypothetical protein